MVNYIETLTLFQAEMERLLMQRGRLDEQIKRLMRVIEIIQTLAEENDERVIQPPPMAPSEEAGFTDRVRAILKANPFLALTAVEIRDSLLKESPNENQKVMLIHTHNTLKRLHRQSEVDEEDGPEGRKAYRIKLSNFAALASLGGSLPPGGILSILSGLGDEKKK